MIKGANSRSTNIAVMMSLILLTQAGSYSVEELIAVGDCKKTYDPRYSTPTEYVCYLIPKHRLLQ